MTRTFDILIGPLDWLPPLAGLVVVSVITAVAVLLAFKWTADQPALRSAKRAMQAAILEMRLFNDDIAGLVRAQGEMFRQTLRYLRLSLAPTLWLLAPMLALMPHLEVHFGYRGLTSGEPALLKVRFAAAANRPRVALEAPDGVRVETPAVAFPSTREVVWRVRPHTPGTYELRVDLGGTVLTKTLLVSDAVARRSPVRPGGHLIDQWLYPSEPPLPAGLGVSAISIDYPERDFAVAGWDLGWLGIYVVLTLAFALVLKRPFNVAM